MLAECCACDLSSEGQERRVPILFRGGSHKRFSARLKGGREPCDKDGHALGDRHPCSRLITSQRTLSCFRYSPSCGLPFRATVVDVTGETCPRQCGFLYCRRRRRKTGSIDRRVAHVEMRETHATYVTTIATRRGQDLRRGQQLGTHKAKQQAARGG